MSVVSMPMPSRKRALELGAGFIQHDLDQMRARARSQYEERRLRAGEGWDGAELPLSTSLESDLMKAAEWAAAIAMLREMARNEP